jgi:hypothetical protein
MDHAHYSIYASAIYVLTIFGGKMIMTDKKRYELRRPLVLWNLMLAVFSIAGASRMLPLLLQQITNYGFTHTVCDRTVLDNNYIIAFWGFLFALSKLPELGDTAFVVLRKQPLIFLHWYHHITVFIYCWYSHHQTSSGFLFGSVNFTIHALMYSYYTLKALKIYVPKQVSILITFLQLSQMVIGCCANFVAYQAHQHGQKCDVSLQNIGYSMLMYFSYFLLFGHFFYKAYLSGKKSIKITEKIN